MGDPNRLALEAVARSLGEMNKEIVYVGGAVVGLLVTDPAAPSIRITQDVDCIIEVSARSDYDTRVRSMLLDKGFSEMQGEGIPICAWTINGLRLDVMPTDDSLGFNNRWYKGAMNNANTISLGRDEIRVITAPYFLATKFEAFQSRGLNDYLYSHDLEDIITVIDGRPEVVADVNSSDDEVRKYLAAKFVHLLNEADFISVLPGIVVDEGRGPIVLERMRQMTNS